MKQPVRGDKKHFLYYVFTVMTKANTFPEFSAVGVANGRQIKHFSNEERVWVRDGRTVFDWTNTPEDPPDSRDWFIHQLKMLSDCTDSQCSDHVLIRGGSGAMDKTHAFGVRDPGSNPL
ncbi:unnamed protein product [Leuciscus chuanchicus]